MNTNLETALIVLVFVVVMLVIFLVPVLFQLWRSAKNMTAALETINHSLPAILKNVEELTGNVNQASYELKAGIEQVSSGIKKAQAAMGILDVLTPLVYSKVPAAMAGKLLKLVALFRGLKVFLAVLQTGKAPAVKAAGSQGAPDPSAEPICLPENSRKQ